MCRFVLYMGPPITLDLLTTRPVNSIIHQSHKSRLGKEPLNGDGFGMAWYVPEISPEPAQFRCLQPAWNNVNLLHLARVTRSPVILVHVRAASPGFGVSEANCHPFTAGRFAFMHNGAVAEFPRLKRQICDRLSDQSYLWIHGTTDSEHMLARYRDHFSRAEQAEESDRMADALAATITEVVELTRDVDATRNSYLNLAVTDGIRAVVTRYATGGAEPHSLFYTQGLSYSCEDDVCDMRGGPNDFSSLIVASEPLTDGPGWTMVPANHMLVVQPNLPVRLRSLESR